MECSYLISSRQMVAYELMNPNIQKQATTPSSHTKHTKNTLFLYLNMDLVKDILKDIVRDIVKDIVRVIVQDIAIIIVCCIVRDIVKDIIRHTVRIHNLSEYLD